MLVSIRRKERFAYPLPALREVLLNAVIHRNYTDGSDIQIKTVGFLGVWHQTKCAGLAMTLDLTRVAVMCQPDKNIMIANTDTKERNYADIKH